jgi:small subunit ribosomal protein S21
MLKVPVVKGNINRALKDFKKKFRDTKTLQKLRDRKEYTKPSVEKRQAKEKAIIRDKYRGQEAMIPIQVFACAKCGHINKGFLPKGE